LQIYLLKRLLGKVTREQDASVIDQDVEAAEVGDGLLYRRLGGVTAGGVGLDGDRLAT